MKMPGYPHKLQFHVTRSNVGVPGTEIIDAINLPPEFRWFTTNYGITVPSTWFGNIVYRGRRYSMKPGLAFCNEPGEVVTTHRPFRVGSFRAFGLEPEAFRMQLEEHGFRRAAAGWRLVAPAVSARLSRCLRDVFRLVNSSATAMQIQSSVVEVTDVLLTDFVDSARTMGTPIPVQARAAQRIRECLLYDDDATLDLETLSRRVGMSRFQVLRTFKRHYGLPPHAYQLCVRIGRAREALKTGAPAAEVAARFGFVDQSHFIRHFKRFVGVTPSLYARCSTPKSIDDSWRDAESGRLLATAYRRDCS